MLNCYSRHNSYSTGSSEARNGVKTSKIGWTIMSSRISISVHSFVLNSSVAILTVCRPDSSVSGSRLRASGSPLLAHFIRATAEELPHPTDSGRTLWDATTDNGKLFGLHASNVISEEVRSVHEMQYTAADSVGVSPLGSGSDYTVFLQRSGVCPLVSYIKNLLNRNIN